MSAKNILLLIAVVGLGFYAIQYFPGQKSPEPVTGDTFVCTMDAKMCPDGSYVGRTGPACEFKCPTGTAPTDTSGKITLGLDQSAVVLGLTIKPWAVTQDSRCPSDVTCIQAGKVVVAVNFQSPKGILSTKELEVGNTITIEDISVTLDQVMPYPVSTHKTTDAEYKFTFIVKGK